MLRDWFNSVSIGIDPCESQLDNNPEIPTICGVISSPLPELDINRERTSKFSDPLVFRDRIMLGEC